MKKPLDPDPANREWEYDGHGVKRYKDTFAIYDEDVCPVCKKSLYSNDVADCNNPRCSVNDYDDDRS